MPPVPPPKEASPIQLSRKFTPPGILKKPAYGPPPSPSSSTSFEPPRLSQTMPRNLPPPSPDLKMSQSVDSRQHQFRPMPSSQSNSGSFVSLNEAAVIYLNFSTNNLLDCDFRFYTTTANELSWLGRGKDEFASPIQQHYWCLWLGSSSWLSSTIRTSSATSTSTPWLSSVFSEDCRTLRYE